MGSLVLERLARTDLNLETRRWKAFLRMTGETKVDTEKDILTEFKVVADFMKCLGLNYQMIVQVEDSRTAESNTVASSGPSAGEERPLGGR